MSKFRGQGFENTRVDTRPRSDEAVAAGMRNIHRDTRGNVIGAMTAEGQGIGTRSSKYRSGAAGSSATPRLDAGVQTPRLDSNPSQPIRYNTAADRAAEKSAASQKSALAGGFGIGAQKKAQNLEGRQSLFRDMKTTGQGGMTPDMEQRAKGLGVSQSRFRQVAGKLPAAPASIAVTNPTNAVRPPMASPLDTAARPVQAAAPVATLAAPMTGAAKANADMAKYGVQGAVQRALASSKYRKPAPAMAGR